MSISSINGIISFDKGVLIADENDITKKPREWAHQLRESYSTLRNQVNAAVFPNENFTAEGLTPSTGTSQHIHVEGNHKCYPAGTKLTYIDGTVIEVPRPVKGNINEFERSMVVNIGKMYNMHLLINLVKELVNRDFEHADNIMTIASLLYDLAVYSANTQKIVTIKSVLSENVNIRSVSWISIMSECGFDSGDAAVLSETYKTLHLDFDEVPAEDDRIKWSFTISTNQACVPIVVFTSCEVPNEGQCKVAVYTKDFSLDIASNVQHLISKGSSFTFTAVIDEAVLGCICINGKKFSNNLFAPDISIRTGASISELACNDKNKHAYNIGIANVNKDITIELYPAMLSKAESFLRFMNVSVDRLIKQYCRTPGEYYRTPGIITWDLSLVAFVDFEITEYTKIRIAHIPLKDYGKDIIDSRNVVNYKTDDRITCFRTGNDNGKYQLRIDVPNIHHFANDGNTMMIRVIFSAGAASVDMPTQHAHQLRNSLFAVQFEIDMESKKIIQTYAQYLTCGLWNPRVPQELLQRTVGIISPYCRMEAFDAATGIYNIVFNEGFNPADIVLGIPADTNYHMCKMEVPIEYEDKYFAILKIPTHSIGNSCPIMGELTTPISERAIYDAVTVKSNTRQLFNLDCANLGINEDTNTAVYANPKLIVKDNFALIPVIFSKEDNIELTIIEDEKLTTFRFVVCIDYPTDEDNTPDDGTTDDLEEPTSPSDGNTEAREEWSLPIMSDV